MTYNQDDCAANSQTTGRLAVGQAINGVVNATQDKDWFAIDLVADASNDSLNPGRNTLKKLNVV